MRTPSRDAAQLAAIGLASRMARSTSGALTLHDLKLPTYLQTVLQNHGLGTARDLARLSEEDLRTIPGVAGTSIRKIKFELLEHGMSLRSGKVPGNRDTTQTPPNKETDRVPTRQHRQTLRRRPPA